MNEVVTVRLDGLCPGVTFVAEQAFKGEAKQKLQLPWKNMENWNYLLSVGFIRAFYNRSLKKNLSNLSSKGSHAGSLFPDEEQKRIGSCGAFNTFVTFVTFKRRFVSYRSRNGPKN